MTPDDPALARLLRGLDDVDAHDALQDTHNVLDGEDAFRARTSALISRLRAEHLRIDDASLERVLAAWTSDLLAPAARASDAAVLELEVVEEALVQELLGRPRGPREAWPLLMLEVRDGVLHAELGRLPQLPEGRRVRLEVSGEHEAALVLTPSGGVLLGSAPAPGLQPSALGRCRVGLVVLGA